MKKAAMFGLDARIALAIFGALSVISGAALVSVLNNTKIVKLQNDINEFGKAWEQYYLDTGEYLPQPNSYTIASHAKYHRNMTELVESSSLDGWSGPYLNYEVGSYDYYVDNDYYDQTYFILKTFDYSSYCSDSDDCYLWILMRRVPTEIAEAFDEIVDGELNYTDGKVRMTAFSGDVAVVYRYSPTKLTF